MVNSEKRIPLGLILFLTPLFRFKQQSIHDENEERTYVVLIIAKVCLFLFCFCEYKIFGQIEKYYLKLQQILVRNSWLLREGGVYG